MDRESENKTGLIYANARYLDPDTGRFLSFDPFEGYDEKPISLHRYLYAYQNPVVYVDPDGEAVVMAAIGAYLLYTAATSALDTAAEAAIDAGVSHITGNESNFDVVSSYAENLLVNVATFGAAGKAKTGVRIAEAADTINDARKRKKSAEASAVKENPVGPNNTTEINNTTKEIAPVSPPKRHTREKSLSDRKKHEIKEKVEKRAASKNEWKKLESDRRFDNRRKRGIDKFWSEEKKRIKSGQEGTRNWSEEQKEAILASNRKRPTHDGKPIEGHHKYNAKDYPHLADDPDNIYPATKAEHHQRWHGGNFQNETAGKPLNPLFEEEF